jgi:hypothetical protein
MSNLWGSQSWLQPPFRRLFAGTVTADGSGKSTPMKMITGLIEICWRTNDAWVTCRRSRISTVIWAALSIAAIVLTPRRPALAAEQDTAGISREIAGLIGA